jgi:hypothetical protein
MSEIKVNKISPRAACGTVQLGDSGDTFTIPAGATINNQGTATNFGATGSASWVTTVKTSGFTAVAGEGYFVNTTSGPISVNLPAGTAGAVVAIKDYAGTFDTNKVTLVQNGSDKIGGSTTNSVLTTEGIAVTLVFIDSTQGWLVTDSGLQSEAPGPEYISATGGTITTAPCGDFKIHTFTGPGTFTVCSTGNPAGSDTVSYVVVAGGGSGGATHGGGGGAGGYREGKATTCSFTASPLAATSGLPVSAQGYPIVVGGGGAAPAYPVQPPYSGGSGNNSSFSTITATAGGRGGGGCAPHGFGADGGSGGGAGNSGPFAGGSGNTPSVIPAQGTDGGNGNSCGGTGGGGGATVAGSPTSSNTGGNGGAGATSSINATPTARAGGGGGGASGGSSGTGGTGGGGTGKVSPQGQASSATANTGGGGGGGSSSGGGGAGGSGIVIIRYKFQN